MRSRVLWLALLLAPTVHAAELHLLCDQDAQNSTVFVNDRYQGNCPLAITLSNERHALRVQKILPDGTRKVFQSPVDLRHTQQEYIQVQLSDPEPYQLTLTPVANESEDTTLQPVLNAALNNDSEAIVALYEYYGGANGFTPQPNKQAAWHERYTSIQWLQLVNLRHSASHGDLHAIHQLIGLLQVLQEQEHSAEIAFWIQREQALTAFYSARHQRYQQYLQAQQKHPWGWPLPNLFASRHSGLFKTAAALPALALGIVATPVIAIQRSSLAVRYREVKQGPSQWAVPETLRGGFQP